MFGSGQVSGLVGSVEIIVQSIRRQQLLMDVGDVLNPEPQTGYPDPHTQVCVVTGLNFNPYSVIIIVYTHG
jgi:hypothetical protein